MKTKHLTATDEQMATIRAQAYNDTAREMSRTGVALSYEQAAEIGPVGLHWLGDRLRLRVQPGDTCVLAMAQLEGGHGVIR